ncbi:hypothetical protein JLK41_12910 [Ectopseudomonas khazarica]|nr:hypothetical protein JLK41_12910 [Pseudomonas khazarica]
MRRWLCSLTQQVRRPGGDPVSMEFWAGRPDCLHGCLRYQLTVEGGATCVWPPEN